MLSQSKLQLIICTSRISEAAHFYADVLGLPLQSKSDQALVFRVGGSDLRVSPVPDTKPSEHTVAGFSVTNLAAAVEWLEQGGGTLERFDGFPHREDGILETPDGAHVVWFRDPDGNLLSVVEFPAEN